MTKTNLSTIIDKPRRSQSFVIANLLIEEKALKAALEDLAPAITRASSSACRFRWLSVTHSTWQRFASICRGNQLSIAYHTNTLEVRTLRVSARSGKALAA